MRVISLAAVAAAAMVLLTVTPAGATPVCTDGFMGGPPLALCGGRIFPEAELARSYVQFNEDPRGFSEYRDGIRYLAQKYPRWVSVFTLSKHYDDRDAVSAGPDRIRPNEPGDTGDGRNIWVVKVTDHEVPDEGKQTLLFSLAVHGNEGGGREGGLRTAEDLAVAATDGGTISDGIPNYSSTTGRTPEFHTYEVKDVLAQQVVYLVDFNVDGWASGDHYNRPPGLYSRGNSLGTDLNRQMPTVGRINSGRNPLEETEMLFGHRFMHEVAAEGVGGLMAHGADIHGELNSRAYVDIMYPAGQFDSVDHRRLMAIAERVKSVIDATLYEGIQDEIEEATGGNDGEGIEDLNGNIPGNTIPSKPAHWATVWDTLGYTDTGFIGDYMATDLAVTGMDYEIMLNHTAPEKVWNVYLQENHINGTRAMIKTSMAYALYQEQEFNEDNVVVDPGGTAGFVVNPDTVTDTDEDGPGDGYSDVSANDEPVVQQPYESSNQQWFRDTNALMPQPFLELASGDIAADGSVLDEVDSLVLADVPLPEDPQGRPVDAEAYYANLRAWVHRGGNLVLTDRALHALGSMGIVPAGAVQDIQVYQPYANIVDLGHPMVEGLRANARQLVEATLVGYGIGDSASPMTIVETPDWSAAGGHTVGTTGPGSGASDNGSRTSIGQIPLGAGRIRIIGGALPTATEKFDHRYGLRDYAMTYTAVFIMENSIKYDAPGLGTDAPGGPQPGDAAVALIPLPVLFVLRRRRRPAS